MPTRFSRAEVGTSHEGRAIKALKITGANRANANKGFWMDGGLHSREWITTATIIWSHLARVELTIFRSTCCALLAWPTRRKSDSRLSLAVTHHVLEHYVTDADVKELVDGTPLYFAPVLQPDGYEWSWATPSYLSSNIIP